MEWNPEGLRDSNPLPMCVKRVVRDIADLMEQSEELNIYVHCDNDQVNRMQALIMGPQDTPYEGGMFHFLVGVPNNYPHNHPKMKLLTTDCGKVRFNPNLYSNGKVCLSLLGTWPGAAWTAAMNLRSLLISVQSLMGTQPLENEPGISCTKQRHEMYNSIITYQTLRVAVCNNVETVLQKSEQGLVDPFFKQILQYFCNNFDRYGELLRKLLTRLNGVTSMRCPLDGHVIVFEHDAVRRKLTELMGRIESLKAAGKLEEISVVRKPIEVICI